MQNLDLSNRLASKHTFINRQFFIQQNAVPRSFINNLIRCIELSSFSAALNLIKTSESIKNLSK